MFRAPFSFEGRIRRTEYGISLIAYTLVIVIAQGVLIGFEEDPKGGAGASLAFLAIMLPCIYFMIAQAAKRCHDRGNNGWWQLIPFYGLWLLFADSDHGRNEYGDNPKGIGNEHFTFENQYDEVNH